MEAYAGEMKWWMWPITVVLYGWAVFCVVALAGFVFVLPVWIVGALLWRLIAP